MKILKNIFLLLPIFILLFLPINIIGGFYINFANALEVNSYPSVLGFTLSKNPTLIEYVKYFFNLGMAVAGALAVLVILFGGVYYLISFGRGKFTEEGKNWVKAGIIGLLILVSAYLIAYTINPDLVVLRLEKLFPVGFNIFPNSPGSPQNSPTTSYEEIPLGILTENLLTRTTDCYDFDGNGDPVEGKKITTDDNMTMYGPTYLEHDRADCFLKLGQAAEKKALISKKLSDEIVNLMNQCSCDGVCGSTCNDDNDGCQVSGDKCTGSCVNGACKPAPGATDCCPQGVKDKAEHGPIKIAGYDGIIREYKGLNEFRSQHNNDYLKIKDTTEIRPAPKLNGKEITVINTGNCAPCNQPSCQNSRQNCLKNTPWYKLRLADQLTYLQGKIGEMKQKVQADMDNLDKARNTLAECSAKDAERSSVDIMHIQEETKKENKTIDIKRNFQDPETKQEISASKYCNGFNYANSNCFQQCQNACPDSSQQALDCYGKKCKKCDPSKSDYVVCLKNQEKCAEDCFNSKPCVAGTSGGNFQQCITSCRSQCSDNCSKISSGPDFKICQDQCNNDSKCILENKDKCLINSQFFQQCGSQVNDYGNLKSCIDNSYLCEYGSNQNAGYPDCLKSYYDCIINFKNYGLQSSSECLAYISSNKQYSSSFLYQNPTYQQCQNPYAQLYQNNSGSCLDFYPGTTKCPASSQCSQCPCGIIDETINYSPATPANPSSCTSSSSSSSSSGGGCACPGGIPGTPSCYPPCSSSSSGGSSSGSSSSSSGGGSSTRITEYRVVTSQCSDFTYNGDPLTFYCRINWEPQAPISGQWIQIRPENEIPVGQTVDGAMKWAQDFINNIDKVAKKVESMIQYIKRIAQKTGYCKCDSKCENSKPVCHTDCKYTPPTETTVTDPNTGTETTVTTPASCSYVPCSGKGCQVMIDLLIGATCQKACGKGEGMAYYYNQINKAVKDFMVYVLSEKRSDILKELTYSRKKMDECSQQSTSLGGEAIKTFSCTKAYLHTTTLSKRCYGILDGQTKNITQTDNWFCAKTLLK